MRLGFDSLHFGANFRYRSLIPVTFLTGFYVAEVVRRYWDQFMSLPFPDLIALKLVTFVPGKVSNYHPSSGFNYIHSEFSTKKNPFSAKLYTERVLILM